MKYKTKNGEIKIYQNLNEFKRIRLSEKVSLYRLHTVWFHAYNVLEMIKLRDGE